MKIAKIKVNVIYKNEEQKKRLSEFQKFLKNEVIKDVRIESEATGNCIAGEDIYKRTIVMEY